MNGDMEFPTEAQERTLERRLRKWVTKYQIEHIDIVPHREYANKSCYGVKLNDEWAQSLLNKPILYENSFDLQEKVQKLDRLRKLLLRLKILLEKLNRK